MSLLDRVRAGVHAMTAPVEKLGVPSVVVRDTPIAAGRSLAQDAQGRPPAPSALPPTGVAPDPGSRPLETALTESDPGPLRFQIRYGQNVTTTPRWTERNPFMLLRSLADYNDHIRNCIEARKDQMTSLTLEIRPRDRKNSTVSDETIARVKAFFEKPDKRRDFHTWFRMAIEEVLVTDALSIYRRPTFGGDLASLELIDGTTILPLVDDRGDTPEPPEVAYRQIIAGQILQGADLTTTQLMYRPRTVRTHTPYGLSPTEWVLLAANAAINREVFNLAYYTDGNIPEGLIDAPKDWTPDQLRDFEFHFNETLAGNMAARRKVRVLNPGMSKSFQRMVEPSFDTKFDEWLFKIICAAFAMPPSELGFTADVNKATGKQQENVVYRRGVKPLGNFFTALFNEIIAVDLKAPELEAAFSGGEPEDKLMQARTDLIYVNMGKTSVDELRARDGEDSIGLGPYVMTTGQGPVFVEELVNPDIDEDPATSNLKPGAEPLPGGAPAAAGDGRGAKPTDGAHDAEGQALETELKKWRSVAIKCAKAGRAQKVFESAVIPPALATELSAGLTLCTSVGDVASFFDATLVSVEKAARIASQRAAIERKIRRSAVKYFSAQTAALIDHLRPTVEALSKEAPAP